MAVSREQMATLRKQLEEDQRLKNQAEKAKAKAEKARDEVEQNGYDIGVAENEDTLQVEVLPYAEPTVLRLGKKLSTELGLRLLLS